MSEDAKKIAESIRTGRYYEEARSWYSAVYIGPVSERTFFLLVAILSTVVALAAISAAFSLVPLTTKPAIIVPASDRADEVVMSLVQLRESKADIDDSMKEFFVTRYVTSREGYAAASYAINSNFVRAQSDEGTYTDYAEHYLLPNPQSPAGILGANGMRIVTIKSVDVGGRGKTGTAKVKFSTELKGVDDPTKTQWTAKLDFNYTDLKAETVTNPETHKKELKVTDPQFQVVKYVLTQDK